MDGREQRQIRARIDNIGFLYISFALSQRSASRHDALRTVETLLEVHVQRSTSSPQPAGAAQGHRRALYVSVARGRSGHGWVSGP